MLGFFFFTLECWNVIGAATKNDNDRQTTRITKKTVELDEKT